MGTALGILGTGSGAIGGGSSPTAPSNVTGIVVNYAYVDPTTRIVTINFSYASPVSGTFSGVHVWLEIPDQSSGSTTTMKVGSSTVGNGTVAGVWAPIDLGLQNANPPITLNCAFPNNPKLDPTQDTSCRLYIASVSVNTDNTLVRNGLPGATPNAVFTLVSLASGTPSAGTNIAPNCGTILCDVLVSQNVSGKLVTPILALMGSVPSNPPSGWGYRLYISYGNADPTDPHNLTPVSDVETVAGIVPAPTKSDGVSTLHSFAIATPTATVQATIWAVAGLTVNGVFTRNNIVPGITNSCPITFGSTSGTIDASQAILTSIENELQVAASKLGLRPGSINAATYLGANTITGTLMATSGIITLSAQIGTAVVADANIGSCNVSKLQAGTATFTSTALFQSGGGPYVSIASTAVQVAGGSYSITISSSTGITIQGTSGSVTLDSSGITITNGNYQTVVTASNIQISNTSTGYGLDITSTGIAITQGSITLNTNGITTTLNNATFSVGAFTVPLGLKVNDANYFVGVNSGLIVMGYGANVACYVQTSGVAPNYVGKLALSDHLSNNVVLTPSLLEIDALPSSSPGAGTKQFWYDPTDGDRVKFAP